MGAHRWNNHRRHAKTVQRNLVTVIAAIALDGSARQLQVDRIIIQVIALARIGVVRALPERVAKRGPAVYSA